MLTRTATNTGRHSRLLDGVLLWVLAFAMLASVIGLPTPDAASGVDRSKYAHIEDDDPNPLPKYATPEEKQSLTRLMESRAVLPLALPGPPPGAVWTPGEYEELEGILIGWGSYNSLLTEFAVEVSQSDTNAMVWVVVEDSVMCATASSTLSGAGANMTNVACLFYDLDSISIRHYGPRFIYEDGSRIIIDHTYNRPRPLDDGFNEWLAAEWSDPVYDIGIVHAGGNFHAFSNGDAFMSSLIYDENTDKTEAEVRTIIEEHFNVNLPAAHVFDRLVSNVDATGHIDMWFLPLSDTKVLISEFPTSGYPLSRATTEGAATYLAGHGYTVCRTPAYNTTGEGSSGGTHYTYTNAAIVNNKVFIPRYSGYNAENADALSTYQTCMPGYEIIQVDTTAIILAAGGIHSVTNHVYIPEVGSHISGNVSDSIPTPIEGVFLSADNDGGFDTTDASGDYDVWVPDDWSGAITPTKVEYTFVPTSRSYSNVTADLTNEDYTGTYTPDLTPPSPDPMIWASLPTATSGDSIEMTAATATDATSPPVEYLFECTTDGSASSGWQTDPTYEATGLSASTSYAFRVKGRDSAAAQNENGWSSSEAATTLPMTIYDFTGITSPSASYTAEDGEIDVADSVIEDGTFPGRRDFGNGWANWSEASSAEYAALVGSDDSRYQGANPGSGDNAAMLFTFYVAEDPGDVDQVDVSVELGRASSTDLGWVYIWDYNTGSYSVLGSQSGSADQVVSASIDVNPGNYVETGTGQVTVFVVNEDTSDWIRVDDISVTIHGAVAVCGNDVLEPGEQCDDGNTDPGDCCSPTCQYESASTVCRAAAGVCDAPDYCDGGGTCDADAKLTSECRASAGICDIADFCDGVGPDCPADVVEPPTTECRAAAGVCDAADNCDGASPACPADAKLVSECRASAGSCDVADHCDGVGNNCPADVVEPPTTECRPAAGVCDGEEYCDGASAVCPEDFGLSGVPCPDDDLCNGDEMCDLGVCLPGTPLVCDDADACTVDSCDAFQGCINDLIAGCGIPVPSASPAGRLLLGLLVLGGGATFLARRQRFGA